MDLIRLFNDNPMNIYIDNPYCEENCKFCSYFRKVKSKGEIERYYKEYLPREILRHKPLYDNVDSIYFGGGTPSAVPLDLLEDIFKLMPDAKEKTFEVHTKYYDEGIFDLLRKYNFDAISIGVQSFDEILGEQRSHVPFRKIAKMVNSIRDFKINLEIIGGIGDEKVLREDLEKAYGLNPDLLSVYGLYQSEEAQRFTVKEVYKSKIYKDLNYTNDNLASSLPVRALTLKESLDVFQRFNNIKFYKDFPKRYLNAMTKYSNLKHNLLGIGAPLIEGSFREGSYSIIPRERFVYNVNTINRDWGTEYRIDDIFERRVVRNRKASFRLMDILAGYKINGDTIITERPKKAEALLKGFGFKIKER